MSTVDSYREELILNLSSARELAAERQRESQAKSKERYDRRARTREYRMGDWVFVKFPSDETGRNRKLSQPWHGPYRVTSIVDSNLTVHEVYPRHAKEPKQARIHLSRVTPCPEHLPPGYHWYGRQHSSPGKTIQWVENLGQTPHISFDQSSAGPGPPDTAGAPEQTRGRAATEALEFGHSVDHPGIDGESSLINADNSDSNMKGDSTLKELCSPPGQLWSLEQGSESDQYKEPADPERRQIPRYGLRRNRWPPDRYVTLGASFN